MIRKLGVLMSLVVLCSLLGCDREVKYIYAPADGTPTTFALTATSQEAMDGWPVFIAGNIVPGDSLVQFGTLQNGSVQGMWARSVWGNEKFTVCFWAEDPATSRRHRLIDIKVNDVPLTDSHPIDYWEVYRDCQLYVDAGQVNVQTGVPDSIMAAQFWYTGTAFSEGYLNWPANAEDMVYWLGTWTTFKWAPHTSDFVDGRRTATMKVRKGAIVLLRLQKENGEELRSGVFAGPAGNFSQATELKNLYDLGAGYYAFVFRVTRAGAFENLRPTDERKYGINIGGGD